MPLVFPLPSISVLNSKTDLFTRFFSKAVAHVATTLPPRVIVAVTDNALASTSLVASGIVLRGILTCKVNLLDVSLYPAELSPRAAEVPSGVSRAVNLLTAGVGEGVGVLVGTG